MMLPMLSSLRELGAQMLGFVLDLAESVRHAGEQRARQLREIVEQGVEAAPVEDFQHQVGRRHDRCGARHGVQQGDLAEVGTGTDRRHDHAILDHLRLTRHDQRELLAQIPLGDDGAPRRHVNLVGESVDLVELGGRAASEDRQCTDCGETVWAGAHPVHPSQVVRP